MTDRGNSSATRKFGRYDFHRFDHLSPWHACAGEKKIGAVHVDCRFLLKKSRWGMLGSHPGGVIFLDFNFTQPQDCSLASATIKVTLDENDDALGEHRVRNPPINHQDYPVQVMNWGPTELTGEKRTIATETNTNGGLSIQAHSMGLGGLGMDKKVTRECASRWRLSSRHVRGSPNSTSFNLYQGIEWMLEGNTLDKSSRPGNNVYTAFAFRNSGQPLLMKVEIRGKLDKSSARWKERGRKALRSTGLKFGPRPRHQADICTTLIGASTFQTARLDSLANDLDEMMKRENLHNGVPIEIPDSRPAPEDWSSNLAQASSGSTTAEDGSQGPGGIVEQPLQSLPEISVTPPTADVQSRRDRVEQNGRTEPSIVNLVNVNYMYFRPPARQSDVREDISVISSVSSRTLVGDASDSEYLDEMQRKDEHSEDDPRGHSDLGEKMAVNMTNMLEAMVRMLLQLLARILLPTVILQQPCKVL
ncbi:hypothetical protein ACO1O0_008283 [Amphichorda felina]